MTTNHTRTNTAIRSVKPLGFPWQTQDPFLFCAYHSDEYPAGNGQMGVKKHALQGRQMGADFTVKDGWRMYHGSQIPGFPYHPHRGFETITINKEGVVDHTDSLGAAGRFMGGDVQWMTAGRGIQHSEMFPLVHDDKPNPLEIFQIWLNLPRASKMVEPHFKMLWRENIPELVELDSNGNKATIQVIAGLLRDAKAPAPTPNSWAATAENGVRVLTVKLDAHTEWILPKTHPDVNRSVFFYKGSSLNIEDENVPFNTVIEAAAEADLHLKNGEQTSFLLILEGKPIHEPVVQHGPFVMNTPEEIRETMREYGRTQFGGWPWPEREMTHGKTAGRFAKHSDGTEEQMTND